MVEGARLESVCRGNSTEGSNPSLSAILLRSRLIRRELGGMVHADMRKSAVARQREGGRIPLSPPSSFARV